MAEVPEKRPPPPVSVKPIPIESDRFRHSMYASTSPTGEDHALGQRSHTMEQTSKPKSMPRPKPRHSQSSIEDHPRGQDEHISPTRPVFTKQEPGSLMRSGVERHSMHVPVIPAGEQVLGHQQSYTMEPAVNKPGAVPRKPKPMPQPKRPPAEPLPASIEDSLRGQDEHASTSQMPEHVPASSTTVHVPKSQFKSHTYMNTRDGVVGNVSVPKEAEKPPAGDRRGSKQALASGIAIATKIYNQWKDSRGLSFQKQISAALSTVRSELFSHPQTERQEGLLPKLPLKDDFKPDFISTCKATLERLHDFDQHLNHPSSGSWGVEALETLVQQLEDRRVLISVFGRFNSGKSTLLNALLATRLLPEMSKPETSVKVNIRHSNHVHRGPCPMLLTPAIQVSDEDQGCEKCPYLEIYQPGDDHQLEAISTRGAKAIKEKLKASNQAAREKMMGVTDHYTLFASISIIDPPLGTEWKIDLIDSPGFGDANKGVSDLATTAVTSSSSYVYIVNYKQLRDDEDTKAFRLMAAKDKDVFKDKRVIIAVTHFDNYYTAAEQHDKIDERTIRMQVLSQIRAAIDSSESLPESMVIPICGQWALLARQLKYWIDDSNLKQKVVKCLRHYNEYPCGQAENLDNLPSDTLARRLENASGLLELESRIKEMAQSCSKIWVRNLHGDCERFIRCASEDLSKEMKMIDEFVQEKSQEHSESLKTHKELTKSHQELTRSMRGKTSEVYESLDKKYPVDMEGLVKEGEKAALRELQGFKKKITEKAMEGRYSAERWSEDLDEFLQKTAKKLEKIYGTARFDAINRAYADAVENMGIIAGTLKTTAEKFCHSEPLESETQRNQAEDETRLLDRIKANPPNWDDIKANVQKVESLLSRWKSLWLRIKRALGMMSSESEENRDVNFSKSFSGLEKLIKQGCSEYAKDIRPTVVEYFYEQYKGRAQARLAVYEESLQPHVASQKEEVDKEQKEGTLLKTESCMLLKQKVQFMLVTFSKEVEQAIAVQQRNKKILGDWRQHLQAIKAYLDQKKYDFLIPL